MKIPEEFYEPEVREGFYVPSEMKRYWATMLEVLGHIDRICRKYGLKYFADYGTLIGAIRHGGFIPWDDDIDVSMKREDYERFIDLFNQHTQDKNLSAHYYLTPGHPSAMIHITHCKLPSISVDIFPTDFYGRPMDKAERLQFTQKIKTLSKRPRGSTENAQRLRTRCQELTRQLCASMGNTSTPKPTVFYGIEFFHQSHLYNAFDYDTIFPLQEITFEGEKFPTVAKPKEYLAEIYKNWQHIPPKLYAHTVDIPPQEQAYLHAYVQGEKK